MKILTARPGELIKLKLSNYNSIGIFLSLFKKNKNGIWCLKKCHNRLFTQKELSKTSFLCLHVTKFNVILLCLNETNDIVGLEHDPDIRDGYEIFKICP